MSVQQVPDANRHGTIQALNAGGPTPVVNSSAPLNSIRPNTNVGSHSLASNHNAPSNSVKQPLSRATPTATQRGPDSLGAHQPVAGPQQSNVHGIPANSQALPAVGQNQNAIRTGQAGLQRTATTASHGPGNNRLATMNTQKQRLGYTDPLMPSRLANHESGMMTDPTVSSRAVPDVPSTGPSMHAGREAEASQNYARTGPVAAPIGGVGHVAKPSLAHTTDDPRRYGDERNTSYEPVSPRLKQDMNIHMPSKPPQITVSQTSHPNNSRHVSQTGGVSRMREPYGATAQVHAELDPGVTDARSKTARNRVSLPVSKVTSEHKDTSHNPRPTSLPISSKVVAPQVDDSAPEWVAKIEPNPYPERISDYTAPAEIGAVLRGHGQPLKPRTSASIRQHGTQAGRVQDQVDTRTNQDHTSHQDPLLGPGGNAQKGELSKQSVYNQLPEAEYLERESPATAPKRPAENWFPADQQRRLQTSLHGHGVPYKNTGSNISIKTGTFGTTLPADRRDVQAGQRKMPPTQTSSSTLQRAPQGERGSRAMEPANDVNHNLNYNHHAEADPRVATQGLLANQGRQQSQTVLRGHGVRRI